jgi:Rad3-related DNA helicase
MTIKYAKKLSNLKPEVLAYMAGFIDSDGSLIAQIVRKNDYAYKFQIRFSIQFSQRTSKKHHLEKLCEEVGYGHVVTRQNMSDFVITEARIVCEFLQLLQPYLRIKKKQANLIRKIIQELPSAKVSKEKFIELCKLVNQVSQLNEPNKPLKNTWQLVQAELLPLSEDSDVSSP